jgi:3-oxoacyl-[acyl-carrier protein] reductase
MLHKRKVLITGAAGAIGSRIAQTFHAEGANLVLSGTDRDRLEKLQEKLPESHILTCNFEDKQEVSALVERAEDLLGDSLDVLVNNAGTTKDNLLIRMSDGDWEKVLGINLTAAFMLSRSAVKSMIRKRFGRIINISSVVGVTGNPGQTNYCASKAGMIGFSKALALEIASRGITVNCVAPGFIESAMTEKLSESVKASLIESIPMKHIGTPQCVADAVIFLTKASYVTGQTIHVNGGLAMI